MRTPMLVTQIEYVLQDHETVVSKTDLNGNITYVNQDFIHVSGFSGEELHPSLGRRARRRRLRVLFRRRPP